MYCPTSLAVPGMVPVLMPKEQVAGVTVVSRVTAAMSTLPWGVPSGTSTSTGGATSTRVRR